MTRALLFSLVLAFLLAACGDDYLDITELVDGDSEAEATDGDDVDGDDAIDGDDETDGDEEAEPKACTNDFDCQESDICDGEYCISSDGNRINLDAGDSLLVYRNDTGRVDIYNSGGGWIVRGATARAMLNDTDETGTLLTIAGSEARTTEFTASTEDLLGVGDKIVVRGTGDVENVAIVWTISVYPDDGFYTFATALENNSDETIQFAKSSAFEIRGTDEGGVFIGQNPSTHRILENGSYTYFDFFASVVPGDVAQDRVIAATIPGDFEGHSVSNLDHGVMDLEGDAIWIAGAITTEHSMPVINISYDPATSVTAPDGRAGFSYFSAEGAYEPLNKPIPSGESFSSELFYIHPTETNFFEGMENWAWAVKKQNQIVLWTEKKEGNRVPNGWNSWSTSGSTGGYGTDINEEVILANLQVMADEFLDWGMDWFQIDDGYEPAYGDWWWREDRFPHGAAWIAQQIRDKGFRPGLWMAPMTHDDNSQTLAEHPDWFAGSDFFPPAYNVLDLTNPEVKDYLADLFDTFHNEWGFEWFKMDFSYHALFGGEYYDPTQTREEAYRGACRIIREHIGDDTFFLAVSALAPHLGLIDGNRLTLDNMPVWDKQPEDSDTAPMTQQGFKPTIRTAARRYYLHERIWINHSDLIVFRSNTRDETWPRVTLNEAQAFCSYVGLTGGIVKLGDKLVDLQADHINSVRPLLPIYAKGGRPLDLLEREFPERWHLVVDGDTDGYDVPFDVIGLFNWGRNVDMTTNPYTEQPDTGADIDFQVSLSDFGMKDDVEYLAYEFWTQTFLGKATGQLDYTVPTHTGRVIALHEATGVPQWLGWNRHITMGAVLLHEASWDEARRTFRIECKVAKQSEKAPFEYQIAIYVPEGYELSDAQYGGVPITNVEEQTADNVLRITFTPEETGELEIELTL